MPLYETRCTASGHKKDVLVRSHDTPLPKCACGAERVHSLSAPHFHLKGTGFYKPGPSR